MLTLGVVRTCVVPLLEIVWPEVQGEDVVVTVSVRRVEDRPTGEVMPRDGESVLVRQVVVTEGLLRMLVVPLVVQV